GTEHRSVPFDLQAAPLMRVGLVKLGEEKCIFMLDMHHIISDGTSIELFIRELMALYGGETLPPLPFQYRDYSHWWKSESHQVTVKRQEAYWLEKFAGEVPALNLPYDFPRPAVQSFEGSRLEFESELEAIKAAARNEGVTVFMFLLGLLNVWLSRLGRQEDIIIGTPVAGRRHADLQRVMGMFVNTLAMRNQPESGKTFREFLLEVRTNTLEGFENQDYQFEDLVEKAVVKRDTSRSALFDVAFTLQNFDARSTDIPQVEIDDLILKPYPFKRESAKFDLTVTAFEGPNRLNFKIEYATKLFKQETIERFIGYFKRIVSLVLENPAIELGEIEISSDEEKRQIIEVFNNTAVDYPSDKTIHQLFREQAARTPGGTALIYGSGHISVTYEQLNRESNRLAHLLIGRGVTPGDIVGLMMERSVEMIISVLGILKAGAGYMPIDLEYPRERKQYMLNDSNAKLQLTAEGFYPVGKDDSLLPAVLDQQDSGALAYVIYTSGSTGRPKGVMVTHRNVVRLVKNAGYIEFSESLRILQTGALEFDASTFEIWGALLNGGSLFLVRKKEILEHRRLKTAIETYCINTMWMTAPLFNQMMDVDIEIFKGLKRLLVGGDVLSPPHINKVRKAYPRLNVINGYGPTENTTFSTTYLIHDDDKESSKEFPIGKPISNSTAYVTDKNGHLLPVSIPGELLVGGDGVAWGYLNNPELTVEKFPPAGGLSLSTPLYRTG
ncbi:MAG: AMP-binding protein, partial [bacterium]|nr:AMP-binding protein [bacterium]